MKLRKAVENQFYTALLDFVDPDPEGLKAWPISEKIQSQIKYYEIYQLIIFTQPKFK